MHAIRIDRTKSLTEQPQCGHNRYHPDIAPAISVRESEEVVLPPVRHVPESLRQPRKFDGFKHVPT
jgi:hypothetical protein